MRRAATQSKAPPPPSSVTPLWLGLFLAGLTVLAYLPALRAGFIWDDDTFVVNNPLIKQADGLWRFWFTTEPPDYFPLTSTMLWLEWRVWGSQPLGYHLVNVLLHALSAVLLWRVLARLRIAGAWLAAALFALHPVNVESVAWITERKNTLCMVFYLLSIGCYLRAEPEPQTANGEPRTGQRPPGLWYGLALLAFLLALLSKTAVAPLPLVLLGLAWWRRGQVQRREVWRVVPFLALAGAVGLLSLWFQSHRAIATEVVRTDSFWSRLAGAGWAAGFYLYKALLPLNLSFVYPRWEVSAVKVGSYVPLALLSGALLGCWRYRRQWGKPVLFALGYFLLLLLPVLGFLNIYFMRYSLVADHWQYFAIIGPLALVAALLSSRLPARPLLGLAVPLLALLGLLTWRQCGRFGDLETLWRTTLAANPECWMAHNNLGTVLAEQGRLDEAIGQFQEALRLQPDNPEAYNCLGLARGQQGQTEEALRLFQEAVRLKPGFADAHNNLGVALDRKGQVDEAIGQFQEAVRLKPDNAEAHNNLGAAFGKKGQIKAAIREYQEALRLEPEAAEAHFNLGTALGANGQMEQAVREYQEALRLKPDFAPARDNLARALQPHLTPAAQ